ncbi:MAG: MFS transporter [Bryobacteraceae bacterium]|jgi:AAHS family 4-hydroxybenzoate transporter-like MFS transporter
MKTEARVNVSEVVGNSNFGGFQLGLCILCGLCLIMDGFDVQAMGYVAPVILKEWHVPNAQFGPVFGAGLFGILVGSLFFSMLADKIGRRPVLITVTLCFSVLTFLTSLAANVQQMLVIRFIAGMALGAIMPNAVALVGEYSPRKLRVTIMMIVGNGFTAGAAFGGFIAAWLIPRFGWRSVFYAGSVAPLVIAVIMIFALPESLQFLVLHRKHLDKATRWLKRINPSVSGDPDQYFVEETKRKGVPWIHLFHEGRGLGTILLWIINFMNLLNLYFLASWLPTVANQAGYGIRTSVLVGTMEQLAGMIGGFTLGLFVQRWGFVRVLTTCFAVGCINIALIGQPGISLAMLFTVVFLAGFGVVGGQTAVNALSATYYPTDLRATGIGAGLGIGRIGAIIGPVVGGVLMSQHLPSQKLFLVAAVPASVSAVVMVAMHWVLKAQKQPVPATTAAAPVS